MTTDASGRFDPFAQLPPHIAVQYAYLRRTAALAETIADLILLARDFIRAVTRALTGHAPTPANTSAVVSPLPTVLAQPATKPANSNPSPRVA